MADAQEDAAVCWICLSPEQSPGQPLLQPCACPSSVHRACLARWQLRSAGKSEEDTCRFCSQRFPDWRLSLTDKPKAPPLMTVTHDCQVHVLRVEPGVEGRLKFEQQIRSIFGLTVEDHVTVTFGIKEPFSGDDCTLEGWGAWTAAVECAAYSAAARQATESEASCSQSQSVTTEASGPGERRVRPKTSTTIMGCLQSLVNWYQH